MRMLRHPLWWWFTLTAGCGGVTPAYACAPSVGYETPFSTTAWTTEDRQFGEVVATHFLQAKTCWKQKRVPSTGLMRNEVLGIIAAQERFWPGRREYRERLLAVILSEGGGLPDGNPADPSYGVAHVTYEAARFACWYWQIAAPASKASLIERLRTDSRFCLMVAGGVLALGEWQFTGDWLRSVAAFKYGHNKFRAIVQADEERPITELPPVRHYGEVLQWVRCLSFYVKSDTPMRDCQCLGGSP